MAPQGNDLDAFGSLDTGYVAMHAMLPRLLKEISAQQSIELARPPLVRMGVLFPGCRRLSSGWLALLGFTCAGSVAMRHLQGKEAMAMKQPEPVADSLPLDIHVPCQLYLDFGCYLFARTLHSFVSFLLFSRKHLQCFGSRLVC